MSDYLDNLASLPAICREIYDGDEHSKPNDHCVWTHTWPFRPCDWVWVENDDHLRERFRRARQ